MTQSRRIILSLVFIFIAASLLSALSVVKVKAEYVYVVPSDETDRQASAKALECARLKALADEFGTFVSHSTSTVAANVDGVSAVSIAGLGSSDIAGVWLETIYENAAPEIVDGRLVIRATVRGKARARDVSAPEFEVQTMRYMHDGSLSPSDEFKHRERFDISFISPVDGYVAIYASDGINNAFRLLPDASANVAEPVRVSRGVEYHFLENSNPVMTLDPGENSAMLRISVIFTPKKKAFTLPVDESRLSKQGDVNAWLVSQERYRSWLSKMLNDSATQRRDLFVSITR